MKNMKFTLLFAFITAFNIIYSQTTENIVTLTSSGTGKTIEEAKNNALRLAIEQAFGAFISSKTEILNDEILSDQITSVASGNIQSFEIKSQTKLTDNLWGITLTAVVSVDKLISFVQSKGVSVEMKGGLFAINIKQQMLNEKAEIESIIQAVGNIHEVLQKSFDYKIEAKEPVAKGTDNSKWSVDLTVSVSINDNYITAMNYLSKTLEAISLKENEILDYTTHGKKVYKVWIQSENKVHIYALRKSESIMALQSLCYNLSNYYKSQFKVSWGTSDYFTGEQFYTKFDENGREYESFKLDPQLGRGQYLGFSGYTTLSEKNVYVTLSLPIVNSVIDKFERSHILTLSELETISSYNVEPISSFSQYEFGGYIFAQLEYYQVQLKLLGSSNFIEAVTNNGPAFMAGLVSGDQIISINGAKFNGNVPQLIALSKEGNKSSIFEVQRKDSVFFVSIVPKRVKALFISSPLTFEEASVENAIKFTQDLNLAGYNDWELPTVEQMKILRQKICGYGIINVPHQIFRKNLVGKLKPNQFYNSSPYGEEYYWYYSSAQSQNNYSALKVIPESGENFEISKFIASQRPFEKAYFIPVRMQTIEL
jgi:hypothetical protein